jgi:hypothetical protein
MRRTLSLLLALPGVFALCVPLPSIAADDEVDTVALTSGNRMTGSIRELARGQLTFRIDGAGTVKINTNNVEKLESNRMFDVELPSGERLSGAIAGVEPGVLQVRTATGTRSVPMRDVIRIDRVGATVRERTSAEVELGFGFISADDAMDWTFSGGVDNRTKNYRTELSLDSLIRRQNSDTTQKRNDLLLTTRRFLRDRWFVLGQLEASNDQQLDLDSRYLAGAAAGRILAQSNRTELAVFGGLDYILEDYSGVPGNNSEVEVMLAAEWDWFEVGGDTELDTRATIYQSTERSRTRVELDLSLHRDFFRNFYWSINIFESYDSDPPPGLKDSDFGLTLAVGLSLSRL